MPLSAKRMDIDKVNPDSEVQGGRDYHRREFFGTKKGKVFLTYTKNGRDKIKNCKVKSWTMSPTSGGGEVKFLVPKLDPVPCTLGISNKLEAVGIGDFTIK